MIVDTSVIVAIVRNEPGWEDLVATLDRDEINWISAASYLETGIVVDGARNPSLSRRLDVFLESAEIRFAPVTEDQARIAREAYRDFGKGSGHAAQLNFGDCFAYALARDLGEPLLFKGDDFAKTDIRPAAS
jgi:ribonuclease VapC